MCKPGTLLNNTHWTNTLWENTLGKTLSKKYTNALWRNTNLNAVGCGFQKIYDLPWPTNAP